MIADRRGFIIANTRLQSPPHVPELRLHLADEVTPIWRMTEEALESVGLPPPFWAFAWAGGQALARYLLDHPREVAGLRVLDFAAGGGIVGIAAAKAGAAQVLAADIDPFCRDAVALNAAVNAVEIAFTGTDLLNAGPPDVEVILAGDISYERPTAEKVRVWLDAARRSGVRVLMGDPGRSYFSRDGLVQLADYQVPTTRELEDHTVKRTGVWTFA
jgi:predicted nicotinamide N-methyase